MHRKSVFPIRNRINSNSNKSSRAHLLSYRLPVSNKQHEQSAPFHSLLPEEKTSSYKYNLRMRRGSVNLSRDQKASPLRKSGNFQPLQKQQPPLQLQQSQQQQQQQLVLPAQQISLSGTQKLQTVATLDTGTSQLNAYIDEMRKGSTLAIQKIVGSSNNNVQVRANTSMCNYPVNNVRADQISTTSGLQLINPTNFLSRKNSNVIPYSRQSSVRSKSRNSSPFERSNRLLNTQGSTTTTSNSKTHNRSAGVSQESEVYCQHSNNKSFSNNQSLIHAAQVSSCGASPERILTTHAHNSNHFHQVAAAAAAVISQTNNGNKGRFRSSSNVHYLHLRTQQNSPRSYDEQKLNNTSHLNITTTSNDLKFHTEAIDTNTDTKVLREIDQIIKKIQKKGELPSVTPEGSVVKLNPTTNPDHENSIHLSLTQIEAPNGFLTTTQLNNRPHFLKHVKLAKDSDLQRNYKLNLTNRQTQPQNQPQLFNQSNTQQIQSKLTKQQQQQNFAESRGSTSKPKNSALNNNAAVLQKANIQILIQEQQQQKQQQQQLQQQQQAQMQLPQQQQQYAHNNQNQNQPPVMFFNPVKGKQQRYTPVQQVSSTRENSSTRPSESVSKQQFSSFKSQYSINLGLKTSSLPIETFKVIEKIGTGSYAVVNLAVDRRTNRQVAIKVYDKSSLQDPHKLKNVRREIQILSQIQHFNIIKLYYVINSETTLNLVMEFIGPTSLYSYLKAAPNRRLGEKECRQIFRQVVEGIKYLHSRSIIHRDIKLENLIIDECNNVKIIDFGFAVQIVPGSLLTSFCGTPSYMAPEIVKKINYRGEPVDVWTCGVLLFVLFCGAFPFKGTDEKDLYAKIALCQLELPQHIPEGARSLIGRILQHEPEDRPTVEQILRDPWVVQRQQPLNYFVDED